MTLCPQYGVFQVNDCRLFHPNFICDLCGVAFPTKQGFDDHSDGYKHAATKRVAPRKLNEDPKKCMICDLDLPYASDVQSHVTEPEHGAKLLALWTSGQAIPPDNGIVDATEGDYFECEICETQVWEPKDVHESGPGHKRKERVLALRATLEKAEKDKNGVSIQPSGSDAFDFGLNKTGSSTRTIAISLDDPNSKIILRSATLTGADRGSW
jgi:helicase MOV-10